MSTAEQRAAKAARERERRNDPAVRARAAASQRAYRQTDKGRAANAASVQRWRERHPERARCRKLQETYGITLADYNTMRATQNDRCAICGRSETVLQVDHCHETGKVRGLLCRLCNVGLGHAGDDPAVLRAMAAYLELG